MAHEKYAHIGTTETKVIEECSELIQAICKADRFGYLNYHPDRKGESNLKDIRSEIEDVRRRLNEYEQYLRVTFDTEAP